MLKNIAVNLEAVESMLYYWSSVKDRQKVNESFFMDIASMDVMKKIYTDDFNAESIRRGLSAIQNKELLSSATKQEKRFWSKNMWVMEDLQMTIDQMAQPIKVLNLDEVRDRINEKYPNLDKEIITVHVAPLHIDEYYIVDGELILNFFMMFPDGNGSLTMGSKPIKEFIYDKLCEMLG